MIPESQVPEKNKRILVRFREHLEQEGEAEDVADVCLADVSLYVLDYASECLDGSSIGELNAFDVHCFLADYMIRRMPGCSPESIRRMLTSLCRFAEFLHSSGVIALVDMYEILALCEDPDRYIARLEEYLELLEAKDLLGLQQWSESVLDAFTI